MNFGERLQMVVENTLYRRVIGAGGLVSDEKNAHASIEQAVFWD